MYFADLTPYQFARAEPVANILNVGWLSEAHAFPRAMPDTDFVSALRRLVAAPVRLFRGYHVCEFCPEPPTRIDPANGLRILDAPRDTMGNGEIRVIGEDGLTYVAPVLILHYVAAHQYAPPRQFIDAVLRSG